MQGTYYLKKNWKLDEIEAQERGRGRKKRKEKKVVDEKKRQRFDECTGAWIRTNRREVVAPTKLEAPFTLRRGLASFRRAHAARHALAWNCVPSIRTRNAWVVSRHVFRGFLFALSPFFFFFFVECPVEKNTWKFRIFESFILNLL